MARRAAQDRGRRGDSRHRSPARRSGGGCWRWYRQERPRPALAARRRPVPHPRVRRSCSSRRRWTAFCRSTTSGWRTLPVARGARGAPRRRGRQTWYPLGYNIRPRRLHSIAREAVARYGGRCPRTRRRCSRSRESGSTRRARSGASRSASGRPSSTPTWRACCSGSSSAERRPEEPRDAQAPVGVSRALCPSKRVFDFNQALMDFGAMVCTRAQAAVRGVPDGAMCALRRARRHRGRGAERAAADGQPHETASSSRPP